MAIATLESLQRGFSLEDIMNNFVFWYKEEKFTPYGKIFDMGSTTIRNGKKNILYGSDFIMS